MTAPVHGLPAFVEVQINDREFALFRDLLHAQAGITLGPQKRCLLQSRLARRVRALGLTTFADYYAHLTHEGSRGELSQFVNAMTTNKTDFFRESYHFTHLAEQWAPAVRARAAKTGERKVRVWSAACSSGEEPYTIAMVLREAFPNGWDLRILASDIDTDVLAEAAAATYSAEQVAPVPAALRERYFVREAGPRPRFQVNAELRAMVALRRINLMDDAMPIRVKFDVIFCRNALIYFSRVDQQAILTRLCRYLKDEGLLILGHSESAFGLLTGVRQIGNTIYQKAAAEAAS